MKSILFLVTSIKDLHKTILTADYLKKNLGQDVEIDLKEFKSLRFEINQGDVKIFIDSKNILDYQLVYFKAGQRNFRVAGTVALFLKSKNIPFIDAFLANLEVPGNKLHSLVKLALNDFPIVPSLYMSRTYLKNNPQEVVDKLGLPFFVKNIYKQRREGLYLVNDLKEISGILEVDPSIGFILQKKIEIEKEYRVVVTGERVAAVHEEGVRRYLDGRNVFDTSESIGGWVKPETVKEEINTVSIRASKLLGIDVAGTDICLESGTNKVFLFEANLRPGLTLDEKVSPELPGLADYIRSLMKLEK